MKVTVPAGVPEVPLTFAPSVADVPITAGVVLSVALMVVHAPAATLIARTEASDTTNAIKETPRRLKIVPCSSVREREPQFLGEILIIVCAFFQPL